MDGSLQRSWLLLGYLALLAVCLFSTILFTSIPLIDHDEGRHASISQEMVERGDYLTPSQLGVSFYDKPVLFFWLQAASLHIFGMETWAVRVPGLLCGLLGSVATGLLGWRLFGGRAGLLAGCFQATMLFPLAAAQAAVHDVALTPCVVMALWCIWGAENSKGSIWPSLLGAGVWLGLGILTKGLMGVAFVLLAWGLFLVMAHGITTGVLVRGAIRISAVVGVAFLVASPWYVAMSMNHPDYLYYYLVERHLLGFTTETQRHGDRPFWYYAPFLLAGGMPWIAYLGVSLREIRGHLKQSRFENHVFVWGWLISNVLFLTIAKSKLPSYLLPIFPSVAILAGHTWNRYLTGELTGGSRRLFEFIFWSTSLVSPVLLPSALFFAQGKFSLFLSPQDWILIGTVAALGWVPVWLWKTGRYCTALAWDGGVIAAHFLVILSLILPSLANQLSARELAEHLNRTVKGPLTARLVEERVGSVVFYLSPELRRNLTKADFRRVNADEFAEELANPAGLPAETRVIIPERELDEVRELIPIPEKGFERVGRFRVYEIDGNVDWLSPAHTLN